MSELVQEAANLLVPIASLGAGAALQASASEAGKELYDLSQRILSRLRGRPKQVAATGGDLTPVEMIRAIETALDEGQVTDDELRQLVRLARQIVQSSGPTLNVEKVKNLVFANTFTGPVNIN